VHYLLGILQNEGNLIYQPSSELPEIIFNINRPSDEDIVIDEEKYLALRNEANTRLQSIITYFTQNKCRQQTLLEYFNEKGYKCGKCDICKGSTDISYSLADKKNVVIHLLEEKNQIFLKKFLVKWPYNKRKRISVCLEDLEKEGYIILDEEGKIIRNSILNSLK
jgi:superfamily II DNA helicase RecQ